MTARPTVIKRRAIKRAASLQPFCFSVLHRLSVGITSLERRDVFCLWTFLALACDISNALTFGQGLEAAAADGAEVNEKIGTAFRGDESETFGFVKPFDGTGAEIRHGDLTY